MIFMAYSPHCPPKGMIQVFNRSHYEDILVTRVKKQCSDKLAKERMKAINDFEELITVHNDTHILKFYLHISPEEQQIRCRKDYMIPKNNGNITKAILKMPKMERIPENV
jgi:polyphosphate kinase 2 (PPK2 family)